MSAEWRFSDEALAASDQVYLQDLPRLRLDPFTQGMLAGTNGTPFLPTREQREIYADVLYDLGQLLDEVRFEVALAAMLLVEWRVARDAGHVEALYEAPAGVTMSVEIMAALLPFTLPPPPPSKLFRDPHAVMSGRRHLSRWVGAQLLDSAALRSLSVLDRLTTLLHLRAGIPIRARRDGTWEYPGFSPAAVRALEPHCAHKQEWPQFAALLHDDYYRLVKKFRDVAVHQRRWPSELHGEADASYWDAGLPPGADDVPERRVAGLSAQDHLALLLATWEQVLSPAVRLGGDLVEQMGPKDCP